MLFFWLWATQINGGYVFQLMSDYKKEDDKSVKRDLNGILSKQLSYLSQGRPFLSAMGSWIRLFKQEINNLAEDCTQENVSSYKLS